MGLLQGRLPPCRSTGRRAVLGKTEGWRRGSQEDLAVVLHPLAVGAHLFHHGLGVLVRLKLHLHLQGHEVHHGVLHARGLVGGVLHLVGAVGAVHIDFVGLFHGKVSFQMHRLRFSFEHLFNCFCTQDSTFPGEVNGFPFGPSDWRKGISKWSKAPSKRPLFPPGGCDRIAARQSWEGGHGHGGKLDSDHQDPSGRGAPGDPGGGLPQRGGTSASTSPPLDRAGPAGALPPLPRGGVHPPVGTGGVPSPPSRRPGLRPGDHPLPPGPGGVGDAGRPHPLPGAWGPGSPPHGLLRPFPAAVPPGGVRGVLPLPGRGDLKGPPAPCPGPGKGRPWPAAGEVLPPGEACRPPRPGGPGPHLPPPL